MVYIFAGVPSICDAVSHFHDCLHVTTLSVLQEFLGISSGFGFTKKNELFVGRVAMLVRIVLSIVATHYIGLSVLSIRLIMITNCQLNKQEVV